jgi:hypothetical protein
MGKNNFMTLINPEIVKYEGELVNNKPNGKGIYYSMSIYSFCKSSNLYSMRLYHILKQFSIEKNMQKIWKKFFVKKV